MFYGRIWKTEIICSNTLTLPLDCSHNNVAILRTELGYPRCRTSGLIVKMRFCNTATITLQKGGYKTKTESIAISTSLYTSLKHLRLRPFFTALSIAKFPPPQPAMSKPPSLDGATLETGQKIPTPPLQSDDDEKNRPAAAVDGGTRAWLCVAGASTALFVTFGWVNCIGLFQAVYEMDQLKEYSSSTIAWITSVECELFFLLPSLSLTRYQNVISLCPSSR